MTCELGGSILLTLDENATAINVYLHSLAVAAQQKSMALLPANSGLVRAITLGPAFPEDNIIFSLTAKDRLDSSQGKDYVQNSAIPHASRARDFKFGRAVLVGNAETYTASDLDATISPAGGSVVVLKLVDLSHTTEELSTTLTILAEMLKYGWKASEEMERIRELQARSTNGQMGSNCSLLSCVQRCQHSWTWRVQS